MKKIYCLTIFYFFFLSMALAQSPGSVSSNLQLWVKANAGTIGSPITQWNDFSGNSNHLPALSSPTLFPAGALDNFNPSIQFTNDWFRRQPNVMPTSTSSGAVFFVGRNNSLSGWDTGVGFDNSSNDGDFPLFGTLGNRQYIWNPTNGNPQVLNTSISYLYDWWWTTGVNMDMAVNSLDFNSPVIINSFGINTLVVGGETSNGEYWDGNISEVIIYSADLTATDRQKVESYLALKYGITLDQTTPFDYLASNGTTLMWDGTVNSSHANDISGIGRDVNSALNQKQSRSINSDAIVTIGLGPIASSNDAITNTFAADNLFMTWGNDNGAQSFALATTAMLNPLVDYRMTRTWRIDENAGDVGNTDVQFDLSGLGYTATQPGQYAILIDDDGIDFSNAQVVVASSYNSEVLTFSSINFSDGDYFTIGMANLPIVVAPPGPAIPTMGEWGLIAFVLLLAGLGLGLLWYRRRRTALA